MSTISTHILDTALGTPAEGVPLILEANTDDGWTPIGGGTTDEDGRVRDLLNDSETLDVGLYRMTFETGVYFDQNQTQGFYPVVKVVFEIQHPNEHYHVPLLLSPYGYSTYRGS